MNAPRIWTRRPKIIEPRDALILPVGLAGYVRMQVIRPDGRVRKDTGWFRNLITNVGLDEVGGGNSSFAHTCVVGTGNLAPAETDTSLNAQIASTGTRQSFQAGANQTADRYAFARGTFRFAAGVATGNLAEVGFLTNSSSVLWSRALILDGGGSPTTLTVLADEALDVTYEMRVYPNLSDVVSSMTVSGVDYDITIRASKVANWGLQSTGLGNWFNFTTGHGFGACAAYNGSIGDIFNDPSGSADNATSESNLGYTDGTYYREFTTVWGLSDGNFSPGITAFYLPTGTVSNSGSVSQGTRQQVGIDGGAFIPKTSSNNLSLAWRHTWARRSI